MAAGNDRPERHPMSAKAIARRTIRAIGAVARIGDAVASRRLRSL
jgi:hypothetical protein